MLLLFYLSLSFSIYCLTANLLFKAKNEKRKVINFIGILVFLVSLYLVDSNKAYQYLMVFLAMLFVGYEVVIPGFGIFGIIGVILFGISILYIPLTINYFISVAAVLLALIIFIALFKDEYDGLRVKEKIEKPSKKYKGLEGKAISNLRPIGKIKINDEVIDARSDSVFIEKGRKVIVIKDGNPVVVNPKGGERYE